MKIIDQIKADFKNSPDLVTREIKRGNKIIYIVFLETVATENNIDAFLIQNATEVFKRKKKLTELFPASKIQPIETKDINSRILNGFAVVIDDKEIYAFESRAQIFRGIAPTDTEPGLYSPKDSFIEGYQPNVGLVKRRIKSKHLKVIEHNVGQYSDTKTGLLYIDNIAKQELVDTILKKLKNIDTESILASGDLKQYLINENKNVFPTVKLTERPDMAAKALLEGKIVIIMDTSPFAIIIPAVLADHINPIVDDYSAGINVNFLKVLRIICFILTIITPAFFIAILNYNPETIPTGLMKAIAFQRLNMPFPSIIEIILLLLAVEILRESDLRFPGAYGSAIGLFSALLLGEAAMVAGLASPIMIIVIAITFISSLMFTDVALTGALRLWRYILLLFAALFGLYGLFIGLMILLVNLCSHKSFNLPYMFPIAPLDFPYLKETLIKSNQKKHHLRSKYLTDNNFRKKG